MRRSHDPESGDGEALVVVPIAFERPAGAVDLVLECAEVDHLFLFALQVDALVAAAAAMRDGDVDSRPFGFSQCWHGRMVARKT